ncbi:hypothetical protein [Pseudanabaena sp. PCC 6802]|uniref:hypothetical protein n=1 Tax=Pseudanabaena sp. PCC 6802 TaxID=118173 RepID=UPI0003460A6C|nr:hypothetical protein [Pseudanabaena sp. PCC 6802]
MAKIPEETIETIWLLKRQFLEIVDRATATEFILFETFGETEATQPYLEELQNVVEESISSFTQLSTFQIQVSQAQPFASADMLNLMARMIPRFQARIPALERSIQEAIVDWNLS